MIWKPPYSIKSTPQETQPGHWNIQDVEVLGPDNSVVGTYTYNYSQTPPFFPFELDGQWYALYSKHYTASRVMKLPSCEDVWGEEENSFGFCPVAFYVPALQEIMFGGDRAGKLSGIYHTDPKTFEEPHYNEKHDWVVKPIQFMDFGFVCGCVWGDDCSWKIRFFDFSRIKEGIVTYDSRFGYVEMNEKLTLAESIEIIWPGQSHDQLGIKLFVGQSYNFDGTRPWHGDLE